MKAARVARRVDGEEDPEKTATVRKMLAGMRQFRYRFQAR
jgi:hypothetical protein